MPLPAVKERFDVEAESRADRRDIFSTQPLDDRGLPGVVEPSARSIVGNIDQGKKSEATHSMRMRISRPFRRFLRMMVSRPIVTCDAPHKNLPVPKARKDAQNK